MILDTVANIDYIDCNYCLVEVGLAYIGCIDANGLYAEFVDSYSNNSFQLDYCDNLHVGH